MKTQFKAPMAVVILALLLAVTALAQQPELVRRSRFPGEHCRSQGEHVRGCWVIDLLLAKDKLTFPLGARMPLAFQPDQ